MTSGRCGIGVINSVPLETIQITQDRDFPQREAARFLGIVAYPNDPKNRAQFELSVGLFVLLNKAKRDQIWASNPQYISPIFLILDPKECEKKVEKACERITSRSLNAADMASKLLIQDNLELLQTPAMAKLINQAFGKRWNKIRFDVQTSINFCDPLTECTLEIKKSVSVNALAEHLAQVMNAEPSSSPGYRGSGWIRETVIDRIWAPNRRTLHLALALRGIILEQPNDVVFSLDQLLHSEWVKRAVEIAEILRQQIGASKNFRWSSDRMIKVDYIDG